MSGTGRRALSVLVLLVGLAGCTKADSLILLDLRSSGSLGAPVAHIRLSAHGWPTRTVDGSLDATGFRIGYYGPGDGGAVSVIADALDAADCVLGSGTATVPGLKAGVTSAPTILFVRPQPANGCVPDAGTDDGGADAGEDAAVDAGTDAGDDSRTDADVDVDAGVDAGDEVGPDATADDAGATDADDDATMADAALD